MVNSPFGTHRYSIIIHTIFFTYVGTWTTNKTGLKSEAVVLRIYLLQGSVCRKPSNFSFIFSNVVVDIVRVRINAIRFNFFEADVRTFEIRITA